MTSPANMLVRRYDKGERRFKHVGTGAEPEIVFDDQEPKKWIGKCPNTIDRAEREVLLNEAIAGSNGDRELDVPRRLYAVKDGAIYEAQTSDRGRSYHAYPYRGKLGRGLTAKLAEVADQKGCRDAFEKWVRTHIERHGR